MKIDIILGAATALILFGLALGLPNLSSELLFDFTQLEPVTQNLLRLGLILLGFYFFNEGLKNSENRG